MGHLNRRDWLRDGSLKVAAFGAASLALPAAVAATEPSGGLGDYGTFLAKAAGQSEADILIPPAKAPADFKATEDNILGPFFRKGAPYRAKITPPLEPGNVLVVRGRVWGLDTKRPLTSAALDIWQANAKGRYDNDDSKHPPAKGLFRNRARLAVDETGYYEYETIMPGRYQIGRGTWRPKHIHYLIRCPGYKSLVTQLYFKGDPDNARDRFIKKSLIIAPRAIKTSQGTFQLGTFDIVLARA